MKFKRNLVKTLVIMGLSLPISTANAQSERIRINEAWFYFQGKKIMEHDTVPKNSILEVKGQWNKEYIQKCIFDSACIVSPLSAEEQKSIGKTEKLTRDPNFVPHQLTPKEMKEGKYSFTVKPTKTTVYFFTVHWNGGKKTSMQQRINVFSNKKSIK